MFARPTRAPAKLLTSATEKRPKVRAKEPGIDSMRDAIGEMSPRWDLGRVSIFSSGESSGEGDLQRPAPLRSQAMSQAKLVVGGVDTPHEREAERIASRVARMQSDDSRASATAQLPRTRSGMEKGRVQEKPVDQNGEAAPDSVREVLRSGGRSLDTRARAFMEPRFGFDFSRVRVHTDGAAARSASEIHARAYTTGDNLVFASGQFAPENADGQKLLAHELAHVVQQSGQPGFIQRAPAPSNFPSNATQAPANDSTQQAQPKLSANDWLKVLALARSRSPEQFAKFLAKYEATWYPILQPYGFKGSWTTDEAYLKDFDAAIQKWGGSKRAVGSSGAVLPGLLTQPKEPRKPQSFAEMQYERAKDLIADYSRHGYTRGAVDKDIESIGLMDTLKKNYGFKESDWSTFTDAETYKLRAVDALSKYVFHYEGEHNIHQVPSASAPSQAQVDDEAQVEFFKAWLEGLGYVTSSAVGAMSAGAASKFTSDPKKITGAAGTGAAFEGFVGAAAPTVAGRGSYSPEVVGPKDRPEAVGDWRYRGQQPTKPAGNPPNTAPAPIHDAIPTPDRVNPPLSPDTVSIRGGGQTTDPRQGHLSVVGPDNSLHPVAPKQPEPPPPSSPGTRPPAGAGAQAANDNATPVPQVYRQKQVASGGGGATTTTPPTKMAIKPRTPSPDHERNPRLPSAKEVLHGPDTLSDDVEDLGADARRGEKAKKGTLDEAKLIREAGKAMEPGDVQAWGQRFPTSVSVYTNQELPPEIRSIYPATQGAAQSGPDGIAIDPKKREITVFDATTKETREHTAKTHRYAEMLKKRLPERFKGYTVYSQEGWSDGGLKFSERKQH